MLAGKRVSPQWVRKTLSCERLEDCQRECADEKRFICEGFNYRLDPTGRGQGNCELIEVPLSEMDLYSSTHSRDSNLLNHPDYDYFERDRNNSPSCRIPSPCTDCGSKSPPPSIDYYRPPPPQSLPPPSYGPSFVEPPQNYGPYRPVMPASQSSGGYSSSAAAAWVQNRYDRYENTNTAVDFYRPTGNTYEYPSGQSYRPRPPPPQPQVDRYDYAPRPVPVSQYGEDVRPDYRPPQEPSDFYGGGGGGGSGGYRPTLNKPRPSYPNEDYNHIPRPSGGYGNNIDRGDQGYQSKPPTSNFIPYLIGQSYGSSGSSSSSEQHNKYSVDYWGIRGGEDHRKEGNQFNYHELGAGSKYHNVPAENGGWSSGSRYGQENGYSQENKYNQNVNYSMQWTRRPGPDGNVGSGSDLQDVFLNH